MNQFNQRDCGDNCELESQLQSLSSSPPHASQSASSAGMDEPASDATPLERPLRADRAPEHRSDANHKLAANGFDADFASQPASPTQPAGRTVPRYRPMVRGPMAVIKLFFDGELGFATYPVLVDRFLIGRKEGDIVVPNELWMSGRHAEVQRRKVGASYRWYLVDQNSTNGSFVRTIATILSPNDELFLGRERYRFVNQPPDVGLVRVTRGHAEKWVFTQATEYIGTATSTPMQCMLSDPFLDPLHAEITQTAKGVWTIRDRQSTNGVWYRVREIELQNGMEFQLGEQRFSFACDP